MLSVIFGIALATTWRPGMILRLEMHQISLSNAKRIPVIWFGSVIAGDGVSKTVEGGLNACNDEHAEATIWPMSHLDGTVNIYDDLNVILRQRRSLEVPETNLFYQLITGLRQGTVLHFTRIRMSENVHLRATSKMFEKYWI